LLPLSDVMKWLFIPGKSAETISYRNKKTILLIVRNLRNSKMPKQNSLVEPILHHWKQVTTVRAIMKKPKKNIRLWMILITTDSLKSAISTKMFKILLERMTASTILSTSRYSWIVQGWDRREIESSSELIQKRNSCREVQEEEDKWFENSFCMFDMDESCGFISFLKWENENWSCYFRQFSNKI